jgi:hypothetical protein
MIRIQRGLQVCRAVDRDTACYRPLYEEKKNASVQLSVDDFFKKVYKMPSASTCSLHSCTVIVGKTRLFVAHK